MGGSFRGMNRFGGEKKKKENSGGARFGNKDGSRKHL